jgi:hypothetical protein
MTLGEGLTNQKWDDHAHKEVAHYYVFQKLEKMFKNKEYECYPVVKNPTTAGYADARIRKVFQMWKW